MFKDFIELIRDIEQREIEVVRSRGALALQQTQRNLLKNEIMEAFQMGLEELGDKAGVDFYETGDGIIMEIDNEHVKKRVSRMKDQSDGDSEGYISIEFNCKIKNLDYDAEVEEFIFQEERAEKAEKEKSREKAKQEKIRRDAESRAAHARNRERKLAALLAKSEEANAEENED